MTSADARPEVSAAPRRSRRSWRRRFAMTLGLTIAIGFTGAFVFTAQVAGERAKALVAGRAEPQLVAPAEPLDAAAAPPARTAGSLRVMSMNLAHGRGTTFHQLLIASQDDFRQNLAACAAVIRREQPDLVALQEADGPSVWSGGFDHVETLARNAGLPWHARGEHVKGLSLSYGTALIGELELASPFSRTFEPSPPTLTKGFVVATVAWPDRPGVEVDVVSVHLDFARSSIREGQVKEMVDALRGRGRPLVVIGDLNAEWGREPTLEALANGLGLSAYAPDARDLITFPTLGMRLDWVLVSRELAFVDHRVLADEISDHRAVVADLRLVDEAE